MRQHRGDAEVRGVLDRLGIEPRMVRSINAEHNDGNRNWHVWPRTGPRCVLRRYHARATPEDLDYEHAILRHLANVGWIVPEPLEAPIEDGEHWYCLTRYVPGRAHTRETPSQRRQRGTHLAHLDIALRPLTERLGQRPRWRPQHMALSVHADLEWVAGLQALSTEDEALAEWAVAAADTVATDLAALGAADLPVTMIHGDFAPWNVHYARGRLAGIVDFGLAHLDSRPYELAIARTWRAAEARAAYRDELARHGWPLTDLEEAAIEPVYRAFRIDMVAWQLDQAMRTGRFDIAAIERQLARTGVGPLDTHR